MRLPVLVLALALIGVPALHAQQLALASNTPATEPAPRPAESSVEAAEVDITPVRAEAVEVRRISEVEAAQEPSARNLFTVIGVVVVLLAVVAFLA